MSDDTIFGKIARGEMDADIVYENEQVVAFRDIDPQAPTHVLIIPRKPIPTLNDIQSDDAALMGELFLAAKEVARLEGLSESGYRVVMNCGEGGGQSVFHIHLHVMGGRKLQWPPG